MLTDTVDKVGKRPASRNKRTESSNSAIHTYLESSMRESILRRKSPARLYQRYRPNPDIGGLTATRPAATTPRAIWCVAMGDAPVAPEHEERRLTTVLAADVDGFSRLMGEDEAGTLAQLPSEWRAGRADIPSIFD